MTHALPCMAVGLHVSLTRGVLASDIADTCRWQLQAVPYDRPDQGELWTRASCLTVQERSCSSSHTLPCRAIPHDLPDPGVLTRRGQGAPPCAPGHAAALSVSVPQIPYHQISSVDIEPQTISRGYKHL